MDASATDIVVNSGAATTFVKILIDVVKVSPIPIAPAVLPLLLIFASFAIAFLLDVATGIDITRQVLAVEGLVAIMAAGGAIGVTSLQNKSNENPN